jgi:hypothetical protein
MHLRLSFVTGVRIAMLASSSRSLRGGAMSSSCEVPMSMGRPRFLRQ